MQIEILYTHFSIRVERRKPSFAEGRHYGSRLISNTFILLLLFVVRDFSDAILGSESCPQSMHEIVISRTLVDF